MGLLHRRRRRLSALAASLALIALTAAPAATASATATPGAVMVPKWKLPRGLGFVPGVPAAAGFFGNPLNYWHTLAAGDQINDYSWAIVANLAKQVKDRYKGNAAFNVYHYNAAFYTVPASTKRVDVKWDNCQKKNYAPAYLYGKGGQFASVPFPKGVVPASGSDAAITLYSPSSDQVWQFWRARLQKDGWHACWGGRLDHVSTTTDGWFGNGFGVSATALADFAGAISLADIKAGSINHVMSLAVPQINAWWDVSWPAQRSDGGADYSWDGVSEGMRFRLDPTVDVEALTLNPIGKMIARAAQKYGFVVTDKAGAVSVIAESGAGIKAATGKNPWDTILKTTPDYLVLHGFPWDKMQAMPKDFGKDNPVIDNPVVAQP